MRAGELRHRIVIEEATDGPSSTLTWATFATRWASIEPVSSRELFATLDTAVTHRIRLRHLTGVTTRMRIVYGSRRFRIVAPPLNVDERGRELAVLAEEIL